MNRWFKKKIYEINRSNVEKLLLSKINIQIIIYLFLYNGFYHYDGELTAQMNRLYDQCSIFFDFVLLQTDKCDMAEDDELDHELDVHSDTDNDHHRITVIITILLTIVRAILHLVNDNRPLLHKHDDISDDFKSMLQAVYVQEYSYGEIYHFSNRCTIQYSNKFVFTNRYVSFSFCSFGSAALVLQLVSQSSCLPLHSTAWRSNSL